MPSYDFQPAQNYACTDQQLKEGQAASLVDLLGFKRKMIIEHIYSIICGSVRFVSIK